MRLNISIPQKLGIFIACLIGLGTTAAMAQGPVEAYRNNLQGIHGTARAQGLGGAVGAIGVDPTAVFVNPAGLGLIYHSNATFTANPGWGSTTVDWARYNDKLSAEKNFRMGSLSGASYFTPLFEGSELSSNIGFLYDRSYNYKRDYTMMTGPLGSIIKDGNKYIGRGADMADYIAVRGILSRLPQSSYEATQDYNPLLHPVDPLVAVGLNGGFIEAYSNNPDANANTANKYSTLFTQPQPFLNDPNSTPSELFKLPAAGSLLNVNETGSKDQVDFALSFNVKDYLYFGASLRIGNYTYNRTSYYRQDYDWQGPDYKDPNHEITNNSWLELSNNLSSKGSSVGVNLGALVALGDYGRLGISYMTPQYINMEETYSVFAKSWNGSFSEGNETTQYAPEELNSSYKMLTPGQLTISAMVFMGKYGLVSYDFQYRNLGHSKLYSDNFDRLSTTDFIAEDYGDEQTHRFGVEVRPTSKLSLRAGYSRTGNPLKADEFKEQPNDGITRDAAPVGTAPDFVLPRTYKSYSGGIGYFFSKSTSLDISFVRSIRDEMVYAYPGISFTETVNNQTYNNQIRSFGGKMSQISNNILMTLSFAF